ncbi:hypothetical protein [Sagittula sp. SSi028]|uniref:hypothetical protein n=1 Tax=Sagittula sp. SSi028 TaxID=3400636 RepID=UPI003AF44F91
MTLTACAQDPLRDVPRLADVEVAETTGQADVAASGEASDTLPAARATGTAPRGGLLGYLKGRADAGKTQASTPAVAEETAAADAEETTDVVVETPTDAPAERQTGVLGRLLGADAPSADTAEGVEVAAVAPRKTRRGGLFGGGGRKSAGPKPGAPDYTIVPLGTDLPYGEIARVCDVPTSALGRKTQSWPDSGRGGYDLYDSAPGSSGARTFYMTGFQDDCARQFTAALVVFGSPETWEQIHYGPAGGTLPVSATDAAYEQVKTGFCRSGRGAPCGSKMDALAKTTVFVSVYERFGDNTRWKNILLHDGEVVATDVKG